jgi:hypothetical protein
VNVSNARRLLGVLLFVPPLVAAVAIAAGLPPVLELPKPKLDSAATLVSALKARKSLTVLCEKLEVLGQRRAAAAVAWLWIGAAIALQADIAVDQEVQLVIRVVMRVGKRVATKVRCSIGLLPLELH